MARTQLSNEIVAETSSEAETSSSSEDSGTTPKSRTNQRTRSNELVNDAADSASTGGGDSDNDSNENQTHLSNGRTSVNGSKRKQGSQSSRASNKKSKSMLSYVPSGAYHPPSGYLTIKSSEVDQAAIGTFHGANSGVKQIWHIIAPASLPISEIKSFDMHTALRGDTILEHEGSHYNMHLIPTTNESLLLPQPEQAATGLGNETTLVYRSLHLPVTRTLSLRELTRSSATKPSAQLRHDKTTAPQTSTESSFFAKEAGQKPGPRQQPQGLLMRYHPYGSHAEGYEKLTLAEEQAESENDGVRTSTASIETVHRKKRAFEPPPSELFPDDGTTIKVAKSKHDGHDKHTPKREKEKRKEKKRK